MIDIDNEELLTLREVASLFPSARTKGQLTPATVYRWASRGIEGVVLETVRVGGVRMSSREAVKRFIDRRSGTPASERSEPARTAERESRTNTILESRGLAGGPDEAS